MGDKILNSNSSSLDSADKAIDEETKENNNVTETENILVQNTVDALIRITDMNVAPSDTTSSNSVDVGQGKFVNALQQAPLSSLQQNNLSTPQQANTNSLSSKGICWSEPSIRKLLAGWEWR
ncbi:hypothetical protein KIW84_035348 [Lathyrus oleraceus]|uniref:Uncharacterized protein n=1 Tax=Pisum sativum TaxID=3888 RepID=A0A9D5B0M1_PEA|nr:hypothetical protein KIW84_035348 [Pisum sativum]